jgi:adenosylmethionine-8-amino-7-oxononanoate aminotransferase
MPVSEEARIKKVYANRVRRICKAHDIEIVYDGV